MKIFCSSENNVKIFYRLTAGSFPGSLPKPRQSVLQIGLIFLPDSLRKKLLVYSKERGLREGYIFITRNGKPKDRSNIWSEMKALQKRTGIQESKIFPHNFRHLFARVYYDTTKDLVGLADLLGHSSLNVTRVYTSTSGQMYQRQLNRMKDLQIKKTT